MPISLFSSKKSSTNKSSSNSLRSSSKKDVGVVPRASIYDEAMEMLSGALIIYLFAEIRQMAREGLLGDETTVEQLEPPLTSTQVVEIIQSSSEALKERAINSDDLAKRLQELHTLQNQQGGGFLQSMFGGASSSNNSSNSKPPLVLTHFLDDKADDEIVHAVSINHTKKRITVIFRGSVTPKDFQQDAKCVQKKVENPVFELDPEHNTETIGVHVGFYEYLFHAPKPDPSSTKRSGSSRLFLWRRSKKEVEDTQEIEVTEEQHTKEVADAAANVAPQTRLDTILADVEQLLKENPGYSLYSTGHSLGGALCTLFGFYAAANPNLYALMEEKPVVVYSVASPYVGNWKFRRAFSLLERLQRLQHLRIANLEDMVTNLPVFAPKASSLSPALSLIQGGPGNLYNHVGMRLLFTREFEKSNVEHDIDYPKDNDDDEDQYAKEIQDALKVGKSLANAFGMIFKRDVESVVRFHSCTEYEERLEACRPKLEARTLTELYASKEIVGNMMDKDYTPAEVKSSYERTKRVISFWRKSGSQSKSDATTAKDVIEE